MKKISKKVIAMALTGAMVLGGIGVTEATATPVAVQTASAASGHQKVGGGDWTWQTIPGCYAKSSYYHAKKKHAAYARVGTGKLNKDVKPAGQTAVATAWGVGTTYVGWSSNP